MQHLTTPTVWIIDDDEDDQLFIGSAFKEGNPSVSSLALRDGAELLPTLASCVELPKLIILDVNMPRKNGFETLKELRSVTAFANLPVIMLTTSSDQEDRQRSVDLGASRFVTKPNGYNQLKVLVQELSQQWALA